MDFSLAKLIAGAGAQGRDYLAEKRRQMLEDEERSYRKSAEDRAKELHASNMRQNSHQEALAQLGFMDDPMYAASLPSNPVQKIGEARNQTNDLFRPGAGFNMPDAPAPVTGDHSLAQLIKDFRPLANGGWADLTKKAPDLREGTPGWFAHQEKVTDATRANRLEDETTFRDAGVGSYYQSPADIASINASKQSVANSQANLEDMQLDRKIGQAQGRASSMAREGRTMQEIRTEILETYGLPEGYADGIAEQAITGYEEHMGRYGRYLEDGSDLESGGEPVAEEQGGGSGRFWGGAAGAIGAQAGSRALTRRFGQAAGQAAGTAVTRGMGARAGARIGSTFGGWGGAALGAGAGALVGPTIGRMFGGGEEAAPTAPTEPLPTGVDVQEMLDAGLSPEEIVTDFPGLAGRYGLPLR